MPPARSPRGSTPPVNPAELDRDRFARAVNDAMLRRDLTQADFAASVGVTQQAASDWLGAKKSPSKKNLEKILDLFGLEWDAVRTPPDTPAPKAPTSNVVHVPRTGRAAAGDGYVNDDADIDTDPYPRMELLRITGVSPERLRSILVVGGSLADEIAPNTRVLYLPVEEHVGDGLYVLEVDGAAIVKQVQRLGGGVIDVIPRNPLYERERFVPLPDADTPNLYRSELTGLTSQLRFVGKVVYYACPA